MKSSNYFVAMAAIAMAGMAMQASRKGPRARIVRRYGTAEFKDITGDIASALSEIKASVASLGDRLKAAETSASEAKSLDAAVKGLRADLTELNKLTGDNGELKSLDTRLGKRLDEIEQKINRAVADSKPKAKGQRKRFGEVKSLDAAMRAGEDVAGEVKSLDSDLKQQDIFMDGVPILDYPLLNLVNSRPTRSDQPRFSYNTGATVKKKGVGGQAANVRKVVKLSVDTYLYQPTIDREDVDDAGSVMLDTEAQVSTEEMKSMLNAECVDAVEAKLVKKGTGGLDVYDDVVYIETSTTSITASDVDNVVAEMPLKYRRGAVFIGSKAMVAKLRAIVDGNLAHYWAQSLKEGTPDKLAGYQFIEDENVADDTLLFTNPRWGIAVGEREKPQLSNVERLGGDYKPVYTARYGVGVFDPRASKGLKIKAST